MTTKLLTIVGARPQFIKASAISSSIVKNYANRVNEIIVHTGQHFDDNMSKVFFDELKIPLPKYNLNVSGGAHGEMTGKMMIEVEKVVLQEKPDAILVYGDTNSTLAGALVGSKLDIPIIHVEAGLRSYNRQMPEEINRVLTDHLSTKLFCPTNASVENLKKEGIQKGVFNVGDVMYDVSLMFSSLATQSSDILNKLSINPKGYVLVTIHRAENTNSIDRLTEILTGLANIGKRTKVVFPLHPRTKNIITTAGLNHLLNNIILIEPVSFMDMVNLEFNASHIITDSGGVQKEAFFYEIPCVTVRDETEWIETVDFGWNKLAKANRDDVERVYEEFIAKPPVKINQKPYGYGDASLKIIEEIVR